MNYRDQNLRARRFVITAVFAMTVSFLIPVIALIAHRDEEHEVPASTVEQEATMQGFSGFDAFPTLHPLVVHFPIVLLLTAALLYPGGLIFRSGHLKLTAALIGVAGLFGAILATYWLHPHTTGLTIAAQKSLEQHDRFAELTIYTTAAALLIQLTGHYSRKRLIEIAGACAMLLAAIFVGVTGHYGAELTHVHGVGPRGEFLETHTH